MKNKLLSLFAFCLAILLAPGVLAAAVTVTQAGADSGTVMKGVAFTVTVSGLSETGQITLTLPTGISTTEDLTKGYSSSTLSWTAVTASQSLSGTTISAIVTPSQGSPSSATSDSFDVITPPSVSATVSPTSYSDPSGTTSTIQLEIQNSGQTAAKDVSIVLTLPSGVSTTAAQTRSISEIDTNYAVSWPITFASPSDSTITVSVTPSNADSVSQSITIDVTETTGNGDGGGGGGGGGGVTNKTKSKTHELVPGKGLINNTKLQEAIAKVLARDRLSDQAKENLLRLSASITQNTTVNRSFEAKDGKTTVTMRVKYSGEKKLKNFTVYDKVPKTFAKYHANITITASGATLEVVEEDPEYVFLYPEVSKDQELTITYRVSGELSTRILDGFDSPELYAEGEEGAAAVQICTPDAKRCLGDDLQTCSSDGTAWTTTEPCTYGCNATTLTCKAAPEGPGEGEAAPAALPWWVWIIIPVVIIIIIAGIVLYKRK